MKDGADAVRVGIAQGIGQLDDGHGHEHRPGQEERIDTREKAGDEENRSEQLGVRRDVAQEGGDVVAGEVGGEGGGTALPEDLRVAVRDEDRAGGQPQQQRRDVRAPTVHGAALIAPITLFVSVYLATFLCIGYATHLAYVAAILAAAAATAFTNLVIDRGRWRIGLFVLPRLAIRDLVLGALFAAALIGLSDLLVLASTSLRHARGSGFPWPELLVVYIPAAVHEELVFRGYLFQKMRAWNRSFAVAVSAIVFGTLHTINQGVTPVAVANIIVAGVLLALGYELFERLWFPIGLHLAWNLATGPVLGYSVSGYTGESTLLVTAGKGPPWLTGGPFGLEGSVWIGVVELAGVAVLLWVRRRKTNSLAPC